MIFATLHPQAKGGAHQDERKNYKSGGDETGDGVQRQLVTQITRFERSTQGTEGKNRGQEQREKDHCGAEPPTLSGIETAHRAPLNETRRREVDRTNLRSAGVRTRSFGTISDGHFSSKTLIAREAAKWAGRKGIYLDDSQRVTASQEWRLYRCLST